MLTFSKLCSNINLYYSLRFINKVKSSEDKIKSALFQIGLVLIEPYTKSKNKHMLKCLTCSNIWNTSTISSVLQSNRIYNTNGCPVCSKKSMKENLTKIDYSSELKKYNISILETAERVTDYSKAKCNTCEYEWNIILCNVFHNLKKSKNTTPCPNCSSGAKLEEKDSFYTEQLKLSKTKLLENYKGYKEIHNLECEICNTKFSNTIAQALRSNKENSGNSCPICLKNKNSSVIYKTRSNIDYKLKLNDMGLELLEPFKGAKKHHTLKCKTCLHEWKATPISKIQNYKKYGTNGCPKCYEKYKDDEYKKIRQEKLKELNDRGIVILDDSYDGRRFVIDSYTYTKILVKNEKCGHEFYSSPTNLIMKEVDCAICGPQKRVQPLIEWSKNNSEKWRETATEWQIYKSDVYSKTKKNYELHEKEINPMELTRGRAGNDGAYHLDHKVPIRFCFDNNIPSDICAHPSNLQLMEWKDNIGSGDNIKGTAPIVFHNYIPAYQRINKYTNILKARVFNNAKLFTEISDTTVTLYDKNLNHAIIIIPLDSSMANSKSIFLASQTLEKNNINYTILFEDELENNIELVIQKLIHYTKQSTTKSIHARKCEIKLIDSIEKKNLLVKNHTQGNDNSQIFIGAYYENVLVAVMTFSQPRIAMGGKNNVNKTKWELCRFCTDVNYRIPGIASKLLSYFKNNFNWSEIYSYADRRWSTGNLYEKIGFTLTTINPPDYCYVIDGIRKHRWNYRRDMIKHTLPDYDPTLTEYENMTNHGYYRLWDCGKLKYVLKNE